MPDLSDYVPAELPDEEPPQREAPPLPDDRRRAPGTDDVLPANIDAEKTILGAILLDQAYFNDAAETLDSSDFSLDSHKRIFQCMTELMDANIAIDIVTLSNELNRQKQIEAVGGVAYLASLTEGLPLRPVIDNYILIVKDKAMLRRMMLICSAAITRAADQSESAMSVLEAMEGHLLEIAQEAVSGKLRTVADSVEAAGGVEQYMAPIISPVARTGLQTGFLDFDAMTGGLNKGELIIIAARPSQGKTGLLGNILHNICLGTDLVAAFFSLEMSREAIEKRLLASIARVDVRRAMSGQFLSSLEIEKLNKALGQLVESRLFIDDSTGITPVQLRAKARRLKQREGRLDICAVDYMQLLHPGRKGANRQEEVMFISRGLKECAKELDCPVIALAQLNRGNEQRSDKRPILSDLRESGSIEQDGDLVCFVHRDEYYQRDDEEVRGLADLIVAKQRNGPTGVVKLAFVSEIVRFENLAKGYN